MDNYNFNDILNKCRCCLVLLSSDDIKINITRDHRETFLHLTKIKLKTDDIYSKHLCLSCAYQLSNISKFKKEVSTKQVKMYREVSSPMKFEFVPAFVEDPSPAQYSKNRRSIPNDDDSSSESDGSDNENNVEDDLDEILASLNTVKQGNSTTKRKHPSSNTVKAKKSKISQSDEESESGEIDVS